MLRMSLSSRIQTSVHGLQIRSTTGGNHGLESARLDAASTSQGYPSIISPVPTLTTQRPRPGLGTEQFCALTIGPPGLPRRCT